MRGRLSRFADADTEHAMELAKIGGARVGDCKDERQRERAGAQQTE
jgi:hypothetical protein